MPVVGDLRSSWMNAISLHQEYQCHSAYFCICELHFAKEDLTQQGQTKILRPGAVPRIFDNYSFEMTNNIELDDSCSQETFILK